VTDLVSVGQPQLVSPIVALLLFANGVLAAVLIMLIERRPPPM
jgi:hypothetical protein